MSTESHSSLAGTKEEQSLTGALAKIQTPSLICLENTLSLSASSSVYLFHFPCHTLPLSPLERFRVEADASPWFYLDPGQAANPLPICNSTRAHITHTHLSGVFNAAQKEWTPVCDMVQINMYCLMIVAGQHLFYCRHLYLWEKRCSVSWSAYICFYFFLFFAPFPFHSPLLFSVLMALSLFCCTVGPALLPSPRFSSSPDVGAGPDGSCWSLQFVSVKHQLVSEGVCAQLRRGSCSSAAAQDFYGFS